jgi:heme iron utilization protein
MDGLDPKREASRLISAQGWCALGTVDRSGTPSVSYVPFVSVDGAFGIAVSRLAAHTANLLALRPASLLLVDGDFDQRDAYTRARFSIAATVHPEAPGSAAADAVWSALESRHGATVRTLRALPDFQPVLLVPVSGRLILGFASAHDFDADVIAELLRAR